MCVEGDIKDSNKSVEAASPCLSGPIVVFDLEASRLSIYMAHITQISARVYLPTSSTPSAPFNCMILPPTPIAPAVSKVTGQRIVFAETRRLLLKDGKVVSSVSPEEGIRSFISWLPQDSVLCAHNCWNFDCMLLWADAEMVGAADHLLQKIAGFCDTLPLLRRKLPMRSDHSLKQLHQDLCGDLPSHHDAQADVAGLIAVLERTHVSRKDLARDFRSARDSLATKKWRCDLRRLLRTLQPLMASGLISNEFARKLARHGLCYTTLREAYKSNGRQGLADCFDCLMQSGSSAKFLDNRISALSAHFATHRPPRRVRPSKSKPNNPD